MSGGYIQKSRVISLRIKSPTISISIVSHLQGSLISQLLADIEMYCKDTSLEVLLTLNLAEAVEIKTDEYSFPISVHNNSEPRGFAENHNRAFSRAVGQFFCVMNPDIRLENNPFQPLLDCLQNETIGVVAPLIVGESGEVEDSARHFPTPLKILCRVLGRCKGHDYEIKKEVIFPDWVGGMFMLFRSEVFEKLDGFNERYFLYYEDVDICARLRLNDYQVTLCPKSSVTHHAQRSSHRSFRYFRWHLSSMIRFFLSPEYWRVKCRK